MSMSDDENVYAVADIEEQASTQTSFGDNCHEQSPEQQPSPIAGEAISEDLVGTSTVCMLDDGQIDSETDIDENLSTETCSDGSWHEQSTEQQPSPTAEVIPQDIIKSSILRMSNDATVDCEADTEEHAVTETCLVDNLREQLSEQQPCTADETILYNIAGTSTERVSNDDSADAGTNTQEQAVQRLTLKIISSLSARQKKINKKISGNKIFVDMICYLSLLPMTLLQVISVPKDSPDCTRNKAQFLVSSGKRQTLVMLLSKPWLPKKQHLCMGLNGHA